MAKIKVASRVHRILAHMKRFRRDLDSFPDLPVPLPGLQGQTALGVYPNAEGSLREAFVVTDQGLVLEDGGRWVSIPYSSLRKVVTPKTKTDVYHLDLELKDGSLLRLPIRGHDGRFLDVFEFVRFFSRVLEDMESGTPEGGAQNASAGGQ